MGSSGKPQFYNKFKKPSLHFELDWLFALAIFFVLLFNFGVENLAYTSTDAKKQKGCVQKNLAGLFNHHMKS